MKSAKFSIDYEQQPVNPDQSLLGTTWGCTESDIQRNAAKSLDLLADNKKYDYPARTRYNEAKVRQYQDRKPARHQAEMELVSRAFAHIPRSYRVLDVPCGWGRITVELARCGYRVTGADLSHPMLAAARELVAHNQLNCSVECQDIECLTYSDRSFDTIICFRLFHHFPCSDLRQQVVEELCRVADRSVLLSYLSPFSVTSVRRSLRKVLFGTKFHIHSTSLREVKGYFEANGFRLVKNFAQMPFLHTLHLALFERIEK